MLRTHVVFGPSIEGWMDKGIASALAKNLMYAAHDTWPPELCEGIGCTTAFSFWDVEVEDIQIQIRYTAGGASDPTSADKERLCDTVAKQAKEFLQQRGLPSFESLSVLCLPQYHSVFKRY